MCGAESPAHAGTPHQPGRAAGWKGRLLCDSLTSPSPALNHEKSSCQRDRPTAPVLHNRALQAFQEDAIRVNHQIQDEKVLICKSIQAFLLRAGDGKEGTAVHAAASPLGQVHWQALRGGAGLMQRHSQAPLSRPGPPRGRECLI